MAVVITRSTGATAKGSPLTTAELDQNFINLNLDKVEKEAGKGLSDTNYTQDEKTKLAGLGTAATKNAGTAAGNVMEVGAGGVILAKSRGYVNANELQISSEILGLNLTYDGGNPTYAGTSTPSSFLTVGGTFVNGLYYGGMLQFARDDNRVFYRSMQGSGPRPWAEFHHTGNTQQTTGASTGFPMSQKAVTDQLATKANTSTQVIAGTGLTGGGTLASDRTLSVSYGTAAGTAAQGNDSRLSDSREWTGATISQAEAEAGVATTRRAWTAQSVRQAANSSIAAQNGKANGIASLDANAKIPLSQLSDSIIGQVEYMGVWAASTNTPTLPTTPAEKGQYYVVSAAGTQFGHSFVVGDWVISNGASWDKVDNTDAVSTVNGRTGNVTGLAESSDARFTNSREWTAATITQAEAEAGTATTRRAFTAQSVRQAIVAWFNGISGVLGRTILTRTTADQVRSDIGLGTAATANVGTGAGDLMEVGAFGLGASPAKGQIRSWVLPQFDFGQLGQTDEYLVLFPSKAAAGAHGIKGEIHNSRGSGSSGNVSSVQFINAQSAYNSDSLSSWIKEQARFLRFSILSIDGVNYVAMKAAEQGGTSHNQNVFYGCVIGGDSRLFTRARASDPNVTVVNENAATVDRMHHTGNILQTTGTSTTYPMSQKAVTDGLGAINLLIGDMSAALDAINGEAI